MYKYRAWGVTDAGHLPIQGKLYLFCQDNCQTEFQVRFQIPGMEETCPMMQVESTDNCDHCGLEVAGEPDGVDAEVA